MRRATVLLALIWGAAISAAPQATSPSVFTTAQVDAGRAAYVKNCAECHMPDLSGNNEKPPLAGQTFMSTWSARTTKDLLDYMSGAMPFGGPSLDTETYLSLTAYILQANGAAAGDTAFTSSTATRIGGLPCSAAADHVIEAGCPKGSITSH